MSTLKFCTWNIQNFGETKAGREGVMHCIAKTVLENEIDILNIVELRSVSALLDLSVLLNQYCCGGGVCQHYIYHFHSPFSSTGTMYNDTAHGEYFGVIAKDITDFQIFGYVGPLDEAACTVGALGPENFGILDATTFCTAQDELSCVLPLLEPNPEPSKSQYFPGGRPPAMFAVGLDEEIWFYVITCHLRPDEAIANWQLGAVVDMIEGDGNPPPLMITGDFNVNFEEVYVRGQGTKRAQTVVEEMAEIKCHMAINRGSSHVSTHLFDNFFNRGFISQAGVIPMRDVVQFLNEDFYGEFGALIDKRCENAKKRAAKKGKTFNPAKYVKQANMVKNFFDIDNNPKPTDDEVTLIFSLISDHFPILCEVSTS